MASRYRNNIGYDKRDHSEDLVRDESVVKWGSSQSSRSSRPHVLHTVRMDLEDFLIEAMIRFEESTREMAVEIFNAPGFSTENLRRWMLCYSSAFRYAR
jgi:hypothetical protein